MSNKDKRSGNQDLAHAIDLIEVASGVALNIVAKTAACFLTIVSGCFAIPTQKG